MQKALEPMAAPLIGYEAALSNEGEERLAKGSGVTDLSDMDTPIQEKRCPDTSLAAWLYIKLCSLAHALAGAL